MKKHWSHALARLGACGDAKTWAATQKSRKAAWANCERPDWMLWVADKLATTAEDRKHTALAACACARLALEYVPSGELRPLRAIETAEAWTRGEATIEAVREALRAAYAYAYAASASADAASAAYAYAYAYAAYASAAAADAPSAAASASAAYAAADAAYASRSGTRRHCCVEIRRVLPMPALALRGKKARAA